MSLELPPIKTTGIVKQRTPAKCSAPSCENLAKSKGFCRRHGGGKKCAFPDCVSESRLFGFCKRHGGGKVCEHSEGCKSLARDGFKYCHRHGGGNRCDFPECDKTAQNGVNYCFKHGGKKLKLKDESTALALPSSSETSLKAPGLTTCAFTGCGKKLKTASPYCAQHSRKCLHCEEPVKSRSSDVCESHAKRCLMPQCAKSVPSDGNASELCFLHSNICRTADCGENRLQNKLFCETHVQYCHCGSPAFPGYTTCRYHGAGGLCAHGGCNRIPKKDKSYCIQHDGVPLHILRVSNQ
jgi:hypothetical protein